MWEKSDYIRSPEIKTMDAEIILRTVQLGKRYGNRWAVQDLNITVRKGEIFGFLGPNGAGKSTTIRMLLTLVKPTTGYVELFNRSLKSDRSEVLGRAGGLVESADFYNYLSARENLQVIAAFKGGIDNADIDHALALVGLAGRSGEKVKSFSHGMKQRLGIAQALLGRPEFIILDEPTSGLDPQGIKEVRELITSLSRERAITIFLSSHLLSEIEQTATHMAIINRGSLVVQGRVRDLLDAAENFVSVDARPVERALAVLRGLSYVGAIRRKDGTLELTMRHAKTAELIARLVREGIEVHAVVPKRSLEEYFLSITEGMSELSPPPIPGDAYQQSG